MSWTEKVRALQSLAEDIPDARIEALAEITVEEAKSFLGAENYSTLEADKRLEYAVCALTIAKLILTSRKVNEGSSIHSSEGWGEGNFHPSEISEISRLSKDWEKHGNNTLTQLKAEIPAEIGWIDI